MATQVQLRRGTSAENDAFTGAQGEVTVDTTNDTLRVHDGSQAGGYEIAKSDSQTHTNVDINSGSIDGVTLGTNSAVTEAQVDNININGNAITSTDTNGNIALTPDGTGEVDISKVDIDSGTIDGVTIGGASAGAGTFTTITGSGDMNIDSGTLFVDASENRVGIGTASPSAPLHIESSSAGAVSIEASTALALERDGNLLFQMLSPANRSNRILFGDPDDNNAGQLNYDHNIDAFLINVNGSEAMRIDSSGNLLVGGTSGTDYRLRVDRSDNFGLLTLRNSLSSGLTYDQFQLITNQAASSSLFLQRFYTSNGGAVQFGVRADGVVFAQNTTIQSLSDVRTKENVRDADDGLQTILGLRPVRFDFKEGFGNNRKNQLGFIAQEVETVFSDAVDLAGEKDENGDQYKSVGPSALIPVLVKAIQEQQEQINELKAEVATLQGN